ncbi:MAG TPA: cupredoxin domain-containing protein [Symbiobacteriaceae bacterium]|nr:cupredoxin domain-containing protein [Symbiobacteriaceae bacterium]
MRGKWMPLASALLAGTMLMTGCLGKRETQDNPGGQAAPVAALRPPMTRAAHALHDLQTSLKAGNEPAARAAYETYAASFGEVLAPMSHSDGKAAQQLANANTNLKAAMAGAKVDRGVAAREAGAIAQMLDGVARTGGFSLLGAAAVEAGASPAARVLTVIAREYRFEPATLEVKKGELVTIRFTNGGTEKHEFELEALDKEIEPISPGTTRELTFLADRAGQFEYACHVDQHYEKGMKGTLIVR